MEKRRYISISLAVIILICFFMPWVEVSCAGAKDSASGFDLARDGERVLWFIPAFMLVLITLGLIGVWKTLPSLFALAGVVGGLFSAYLMNRERLNVEDSSGLIAAHVTGWFWLGLASGVGLSVAAFLFYLRRSRAP